MSRPPARGAAAPGAQGEQEAARWVRGMFSRVAGRYDFLNHLLSLNIDRYWRARTVRRLRPILHRPGARVLDICCGTGDLLLALASDCAGAIVMGSDFCHPMLAAAQQKIARRHARAVLVEADALALPFADASLDLVTAAFGFRNLANYEKGLGEIRRVLKPEGAVAILEFSQPENAAVSALYGFYSSKVLPFLGGAISGDRNAYRYLPESVRRFPGVEELADTMRGAGFARVEYERMTGGIVALHTGFTARR
jgi:demethylmenaquinone methyltransferase/2-methoxy-6-polyprenyl-1,4-benzoquinol methylase